MRLSVLDRLRRLVGRSADLPPLAEYGAIGDGRTAALISRAGSVDWCCLPRFDSPPALGRLLDAEHGGSFALDLGHGVYASRTYAGATNVLETTFRTPHGTLRVHDHMPRGSGRIVRVATGVDGSVDVRARLQPPTRALTGLREEGPRLVVGAPDAQRLVALGPSRWERVGRAERAWYSSASLRAGDSVAWTLGLGTSGADEHEVDPHTSLERTLAEDRGWAARIETDGEFGPAVLRSALALRLLIHEPTGAMVAAATTSLPEEPGGSRNWDYRFCWLRDAALALEALMALGLHAEAMRFWDWLEGVVRDDGRFLVVYDVDGGVCPLEVERHDLAGYRGSRPVRFGNAAGRQDQNDVRGYLLDAAYRCVLGMREPHPDLLRVARRLADRAAAEWRQPDQGIWEFRGEPRHFVHSKVMGWLALDRAVRLAESGRLTGDVDTWRRERDAVHAAVLEHGYDERRGTFVQAFGSDALDAACLMIAMVGFLPASDPRVGSTVDAIDRELAAGDLLYRYREDDGLEGGEGAFLPCAFWRVEVLARCGRMAEGRHRMRQAVARANDLGLLSEEADPGGDALLGNFPQALTHLSVVRAALALQGRLAEPASRPARGRDGQRASP